MVERALAQLSKISAKSLKWGFVILTAALILFPFYWAVMTSFKPVTEVIAKPPIFFPREPVGFSNYQEVLGRVPLLSYYRNSLIVAGLVTVSTLLTSSLAGYIFAKFDFFAKRVLFIAILATMMIPFQVIVIPVYIIFKDLNLLDSLWGIIIPGLVSAYGIFLMRQFMKTIPNELIDAARIDGCSEFGIFRRVVMPLCKPVLAALGIFTFMLSWDDFFWPLLILQSEKNLTLPIGVNMFGSWMIHGQYTPLIMSIATMAMVPVLIVFLVGQRQFIEGITLTGLKG
jgi:multiple sugar transport system permease protein